MYSIDTCRTKEEKIENIRHRLSSLIKFDSISTKEDIALWEAVHENDFSVANWDKLFLIMNALTKDGRYIFTLKFNDDFFSIEFGLVNKEQWHNKYTFGNKTTPSLISFYNHTLGSMEDDKRSYSRIMTNDDVQITPVLDAEGSKDMVRVTFVTRKENMLS